MRLLLFSLIFVYLNVFCQENYIFIGELILNYENDKSVPYLLNFTKNNENIVGYSLTDFNGEHETKNVILGTYDSDKELLQIHETDIIYTFSDYSPLDFCYVDFEVLIDLSQKDNQIITPFCSHFNDGSNCVSGDVLLYQYYQSKPKVIKKIKKHINVPIVESSLKKLSKNQKINIKMKQERTEFLIWDMAREDGDKVNIFFNGKLLARDYVVTNEKKREILKLKKGINEIKIVAKNEGRLSPNTTEISVRNGDENIDISTSLLKGEYTIINLIRE